MGNTNKKDRGCCKMTRETLIKLWPVIEAFKNGKEIQYHNKIEVNGTWNTCNNPNWSEALDYRIKPSLSYRPWKPEEVPVGALIRNKNNKNFYKSLIIGVSFDGITSLDNNSVQQLDIEDFYNTLEYKEHSTDNGKTWLSCGIVVEE